MADLVELVSEGPFKFCRVVRRDGEDVVLESPYGEEGLREHTEDLRTKEFPLCCWAAPSSPLEEHLYAAYNRGGPPERAGLAWDGRPVPTWAELLARAAEGDISAIGVVDKWRAVATFSQRIS